jgi:hypothetical protein
MKTNRLVLPFILLSAPAAIIAMEQPNPTRLTLSLAASMQHATTAQEADEVRKQANEQLQKLFKDLGRITSRTLLIRELEENTQKIESLLKAGANPDLRNKYGCTLLKWAAEYNLFYLAEILIKAGADVNIAGRDKEVAMLNDWTALHLAVDDNNLQITQLLINNGANLDVSNTGITALRTAAHRGNLTIVRALLDAEADRTIVDNQGLTALDIARSNGNPAIIDLLSRPQKLL